MAIWLWLGFLVLVLSILALDLGVLNRKAHVVSTRQALAFSAFCALLALLFSGVVYFLYDHKIMSFVEPSGVALTGREAALRFLTGWVIEQSLSLDNIFVIALIFNYFAVPRIYQHRTLFWGIMGALIMRAVMILTGTALIHQFEWVIYIFGALLLLTAAKMLFSGDEKIEPERNPLVRLARRVYPVSPHFVGERFFTRLDGQRAITPLFLVLLVIESTDVMFAIDSIPAVFAITFDPFIVLTSNVFAILNLRSLYFALAGLLEKFRYLKNSLVFVLAFVGVKMLLKDLYHIPTVTSLIVIASALLAGGLASVVWSGRSGSAADAAQAPER